MKAPLIKLLIMTAFMLAPAAQADDIPDMGKLMEKSRQDNSGSHQSDVMKQKRHYKTMKMKHDAMARGSAAPIAASARAK